MLDLMLFEPSRLIPSRGLRSAFFNPFFLDRAHEEEARMAPRVNVTEDDEKFTLSAEVPGLSKEDVKIEVNKDKLVLSGEYKEEKEEEKENYKLKERRYGSFSRPSPSRPTWIRTKSRPALKTGS